MSQQIPLADGALAADTLRPHHVHEVAADLAYKRTTLVNVVVYGQPGSRDWVLIDAGIPGSADAILEAAADRFGPDVPPACILLTHGHFDHVGALQTLAERWNRPIFAHPLEHPYLKGQSAYPRPDPRVGGGLMAAAAPLYPSAPIDVSRWLKPLPDDGSVPGMPGWRWIHSPGHTPGQVAFWRESDRALIAADAFITTRQESAYTVATQDPEMHGPPMYYTQDWTASAATVRKLSALAPELVITGHGRAAAGPAMREALAELARRFEQVAVPSEGRYLDEPARPEDGSAYPGT